MACNLSQTWSSDFCEQEEYITNVINLLEDIWTKNRTITLYQTTEPTEEEFLAAWIEQTGDSGPIPVGAKLQWYNPDLELVENTYSATNDIGSDVSSHSIFPVSTRNETVYWNLISSQRLSADAANITFNSIPQTYRHIYALISLRSSQAAVSSTLNVNINAGAGADHYLSGIGWTGTTPALLYNSSGSVGFNVVTTIPAATSAQFLSVTGFLLFANYRMETISRSMSGRVQAITGSPPTTAQAQYEVFGGFRNITAAMTSLVISSGSGNLKAGSRVTLYGIR